MCVAAAAQAQSLFESFAQSVSVQCQCVMTKSITESMSRVQSQPRARVPAGHAGVKTEECLRFCPAPVVDNL